MNTDANGNTAGIGILDVTGASTLKSAAAVTGIVSVSTNKFVVMANRGNTAVTGTLDVTGATTVTGAIVLGSIAAVAGRKISVNADKFV